MNPSHIILSMPIIRIFALSLFVLFPALLMMQVPVHADLGTDGDYFVSGTEALNRYANVSNIAGNTITVGNINDLNDNALGHFANENLSPGDMILIYQAQGAAFTDNNDLVSYGSFNTQAAGLYEFAVVASVNMASNRITIDSSNTPPYACAGISNSYNLGSGHVQVIRVPQYTNLTIANGNILTADPWDGNVGGIVAVHVRYNLVVDGSVDASGMGFRGGDPANASNVTKDIVTYRTTDLNAGGEKGESILGDQTVYDANNGRYGRGAPANGGGGGDAHNAGGGGGANGYAGVGIWNSGHGFVASNDIYAAAWDLDDGINNGSVPSYFQGGAGGGRGGYSFSDADQDATVVEPGNALWNNPWGDHRRQVGGLGGRPVMNDPNTRVFLGGGGGGGDGNNGVASSGANGGGLVILIAENTSGTGNIVSNGNDAEDTTPMYDDGAGGGGAGGTIILKTENLTGTLATSANGGKGGDQPRVTGYPDEALGLGGGGGGGYIAAASNTGSLTASVTGGNNGVTFSTALTEFPPNGATQGYPGGTSLTFSNANAFSFPGCQTPTAIALQTFSIAANSGWPLPSVFIGLMVVTFVLIMRKGSYRQKVNDLYPL